MIWGYPNDGNTHFIRPSRQIGVKWRKRRRDVSKNGRSSSKNVAWTSKHGKHVDFTRFRQQTDVTRNKIRIYNFWGEYHPFIAMDPLVFFGGPISVASWDTLGFPKGDGLDTHGFPPGPPKCDVMTVRYICGCSKAVRHALSNHSENWKMEWWNLGIFHNP